MSALTILLIRHAEKPKEEFPGPGLTAEGSVDKHSLVVRGWQRAGAWAAIFGSGLGGGDFPQPTVVYAADPGQSEDHDADTDERSQRPFETVKPLCDKLHLTPTTNYAVGNEAALVTEITKLTGVVLVCWEHKRIARAIVPLIADGQILPGLPSKWDGARFDIVLRFDRAAGDAVWSFRQLFPRLLRGDTDIPL